MLDDFFNTEAARLSHCIVGGVQVPSGPLAGWTFRWDDGWSAINMAGATISGDPPEDFPDEEWRHEALVSLIKFLLKATMRPDEVELTHLRAFQESIGDRIDAVAQYLLSEEYVVFDVEARLYDADLNEMVSNMGVTFFENPEKS